MTGASEERVDDRLGCALNLFMDSPARSLGADRVEAGLIEGGLMNGGLA
jgi:hypothetical protein